ncbi:MAG: hypothetical protein LBS97_01985 [Treponema sp.]|jgi:hypothetical protein|nr:hypothetical protein [Treponema sp.]
MKKTYSLYVLVMLAKVTIVTLTLAFGLVVAGCDDGSGGGNTYPKEITITGIPSGQTGERTIYVASSFSQAGLVARGTGTISGTSATASLKKPDGSDWTGTGSYYLEISNDDGPSYVYSNGKTLAELGISSDAEENSDEDYEKLPKYTITAATSSIPFNLFVEMLSLDEHSGGSE